MSHHFMTCFPLSILAVCWLVAQASAVRRSQGTMEFTAEVFRRDADDFSENEQHWLTGWNIGTLQRVCVVCSLQLSTALQEKYRTLY